VGRLGEGWDYVRNARFVRNATEYATLLPDCFRSAPAGESAQCFAAVHTTLMFVGVGRSGTTLLGALLDAHPDIVVANEQCLLKYLTPIRWSRERIFRLLLSNSSAKAEAGRPGGGGYTYAVPGQWQGRYRRILVIGDKSRSAQSVEWLYSRPGLLQTLGKTTDTRIRLIHVIRNPWDTIARRSLRRGVSLERISHQYFALVNKLQALLARLGEDTPVDAQCIPVHLDEFVANPSAELERVCRQLGVTTEPDYLAACAGIVKQPSEPRKSVEWSAALRSDIEKRVAGIPCLERYAFGN
jgi:hypothetical protein